MADVLKNAGALESVTARQIPKIAAVSRSVLLPSGSPLTSHPNLKRTKKKVSEYNADYCPIVSVQIGCKFAANNACNRPQGLLALNAFASFVSDVDADDKQTASSFRVINNVTSPVECVPRTGLLGIL